VNQAALDTVFSALMTGKVFVEDEIGLERAGVREGFKPGHLRKNLNEIDRAIELVLASMSRNERPKSMLEEQVAALREEQGQTNKRLGKIEDVLTQILSAIREGGLPPAPSVAVAVDNTADEQPPGHGSDLGYRSPNACCPRFGSRRY
jgi:hypothetical protein